MHENIGSIRLLVIMICIAIVYITLFIYFLIKIVHDKKECSELKELKEKVQKLNEIKRIKLSSRFEYISLRNIHSYYMKEISSKDSYYIEEYLEEAFKMYLELNTDFLKAIADLIILYTNVSKNTNKSEDEINQLLDEIDKQLDMLLYSSQLAVNRVKNVIIDKKPADIDEIAKKKLIDSTTMSLYIKIINALQENCDVFGKMEWYFSDKILKKHPSIKPKSDVITMKFVYFFYMEINECIRLLDEHIYITKVVEHVDSVEVDNYD